MKTLNRILNSILAAMLLLTLSATVTNSQTQQGLTQKDCSQIFSRTDDCKATQISNTLFCKVWYIGYADDTDEFLGYVFLKPISYKGEKVNLIIGIAEDGRIYRVKTEESNMINQEFLQQFEGKSIHNSFEIAQTLDDVLYVPSKVKAVDGDIKTSQEISKGVKETLNFTEKLIAKK